MTGEGEIMTSKRRRASAIGLALLLAVFAVQGAGKGDAMTGETQPAAARELLKSLEGSWDGTCRTWFEPGKLADESSIKGRIRPILGGLFHRHEYESTIQGKPRHGEETLAFNTVTNRFQVSWIDDFHMNYALMSSEGGASPRGFTVLGKYDVGTGMPQWGWKTVYELVDSDHLTISAYNLSPEEQPYLAVETKYRRVK
jgi:hypothetical protein